jgi:hypothetical protein
MRSRTRPRSRKDQSTPSSADQAIEAETRIQVGGGDADAGGGRSQAPLGGGDIGAACQQVGWRAYRQQLGQRRPGRRRIQQFAERAGLAAGQHRQAMLGGLHLGGEGGHARERQFQLRAGAGAVEFGTATGLGAGQHQLQRTLLVAGVVLRHRQPRLQAAQQVVVARNLAGHGHLQRGQVGLAGLAFAAGRFDVAADAAEQVQLPADGGLGAAGVDVTVGARNARCLEGRGALLAGVGAGADRWQVIAAGLAHQGAGALEPGQGDVQFTVVAQRVLDQLRQHRVAPALPDGAFGFARPGEGGVGGVELRRRVQVGPYVVGADGAGGQQRGKHRHRQRTGKEGISHGKLPSPAPGPGP